MSTIDEGSNEINGLFYRKDGLKFVTVGSDAALRVYDSVSLKLQSTLDSGSENVTSGHSNKVFCAKFHPKDVNMIVSGGWDNTVQIWDQRVGKSIRSIYGPHICGDSIDFDDSGQHLLTGSYAKQDPLQVCYC